MILELVDVSLLIKQVATQMVLIAGTGCRPKGGTLHTNYVTHPWLYCDFLDSGLFYYIILVPRDALAYFWNMIRTIFGMVLHDGMKFHNILFARLCEMNVVELFCMRVEMAGCLICLEQLLVIRP